MNRLVIDKKTLHTAATLILEFAPYAGALPGAALAAKGAYDALHAFNATRKAMVAAEEHEMAIARARMREARRDLLWAAAELALAVTPTGRHVPRAVTVGRTAVQTLLFMAAARRSWISGGR
jgi:hypothetical protein